MVKRIFLTVILLICAANIFAAIELSGTGSGECANCSSTSFTLYAKTYPLPQAFYFKTLKGVYASVSDITNVTGLTYYLSCWTDNLYSYYLVVVVDYTDDSDMKKVLKDWADLKKTAPEVIEYTDIANDTSDPNYIKGKVK